MPSEQKPRRLAPDVRALRLAYLIPASPTDGFYAQLAMIRIALDQLDEPYRSARVVAAIGTQDAATVPQAWRDALERVDVEFVRDMGDRSYRAQVNGRWSMVPPETDVVIFADADTLPIARFDDLLEQVVAGQLVAGTIAHSPLQFRDGVSTKAGWRDLSGRLIGREIELAYRTTVPGPTDQTAPTPFYVNFGAVFMPSAVCERLRAEYLRLEPEAAGALHDPRFSAQAALALAIAATKVPTLDIGLRYNFPNDARAEVEHPADAADIRTLHYLRTEQFDRQRIFSDPDAFHDFLALPLEGSNAVLQQRVVELTGGTFPFPSVSRSSHAAAELERPATERPSVRAVIVNFHRHDLVAECIRALVASGAPPDEIVVVDNDAEPERLRAIAGTDPAVTTIANAENVGYARACNQGAAGAATDYLLFINPDVTVSRSCLERCVAAAEADPQAGIVTPRLMRPDGRLDHACHRGIPTPSASLAYAARLNRLFPKSHRLARYTMSWLDPATDHDVEACSGAFMLVRRSDLEGVGGWDERYWFYGEDLDLCYRLRERGKRVRYLGTVTATHIKGASSGLHSRTGKPDRATRARILRLRESIVESHRLFFRQHLRSETRRPVVLAIETMFEAQRLKIRTMAKLESLRGS